MESIIKKNIDFLIKKGKIFASIIIITISVFFIINIINAKNANAVIIDQVIAVVNKTPITLYDFAKFNKAAFKEYEQMQNQASRGIFTSSDSRVMSRTKDVINILVDKILLKQEEEKAAIYISPKQLNAYIKGVARANNFTENQFFNFLKKRGISKSAYIKQVKNHFIQVELLRKVYGNRMVITKKEMLDYYKKNMEEFRGMPMVDLKLIFLAIPHNANKELKKKIYEKMSKIRNLAINGNVSFSSLARKYSEDPSEKNGGRIGYIYKNKLSPNFSKIAFRLKVGQISRVIKSPFGYTILKSVGKKMGAVKTFKQVKPEIFTILEKHKTNEYLARLLRKVRENAYIKIKIPV